MCGWRQHPTPYTQHPTPYTQHPTSCSLHPTTRALDPRLYTIHLTKRTIVEEVFFFFYTLVTGPRRFLSLKLSNIRVCEPSLLSLQVLEGPSALS